MRRSIPWLTVGLLILVAIAAYLRLRPHSQIRTPAPQMAGEPNLMLWAPEFLGQAFRVVRNACRDKTSTETEHQLFLTLHRQYPKSEWTLRYKSWE